MHKGRQEKRAATGHATPAKGAEGGRQVHGVGGSLQQLQPQPLFEDLQATADGGLACAQPVGCGRQIARLDDADKGLDEFDAIRSLRHVHTFSVLQFCERGHYHSSR